MSRHRAAFDKLVGLVGLSSFCLLTLAGLWAYSGSLAPSTGGTAPVEALIMWVLWAILVAIPAVTAGLWVALIRRSRNEKA